ncbi:MAG: tetratricopeptide repeat protein [Candidatus Fermentibacteraceae bacterium]
MSNYGSILRSLAWRGPIVLLVMTICFVHLFGSPAGASVTLVVGLLCAGFLMHPLAALIAEPVREVFFRDGSRKDRIPGYSVPEALRMRGKYEEAMEELEDMAIRFPEEAGPYGMMIDIAAGDLGDLKRATSIYSRGMRRLESEGARKSLAAMYDFRTAGSGLPDYQAPRALEARGRYEDAMETYLKMAEEYPDELKPHVEMMRIALMGLHDRNRFRRIYRRGLDSLQKRTDRELLDSEYGRIASMADRKGGRPGNHAGSADIPD